MELSRIKDKPYFIWYVLFCIYSLSIIFAPPSTCSSTNALTGEGLQEGIQWLTSQLEALKS